MDLQAELEEARRDVEAAEDAGGPPGQLARLRLAVQRLEVALEGPLRVGERVAGRVTDRRGEVMQLAGDLIHVKWDSERFKRWIPRDNLKKDIG